MTTQIYNTVIIVKTATLTRPPFSGVGGAAALTRLPIGRFTAQIKNKI